MPNGEGTPDPRFKQADNWRSLLLGMLAATVTRSIIGGVVEIVDVNADEGWFMLQTSEGNVKVKIEVSF